MVMRMNTILFILYLILSPLFLFLFHLLVVRLGNRLLRGSSNQKVLILCTMASFMPFILLLFILFKDMTVIDYLYSMLVYLSFSYFYFHFFNMSETARRIRLLVGISKGELKIVDDIKEFYNCNDSLANRLDRLIKLSQLKESRKGEYEIAGRTLLFAATVIYAGRKILGFENIDRRGNDE